MSSHSPSSNHSDSKSDKEFKSDDSKSMGLDQDSNQSEIIQLEEELRHKQEQIEELEKSHFILEQQILTSNQTHDAFIQEVESKNDQVKKMVEEMRTMASYVESVNDVMHGLIIVIDSQGMITSVNRSIESELGYSRKEVIGTHIDSYFLHEDLDLIASNYSISNDSGNTIGSCIYQAGELHVEARIKVNLKKNHYVYYSVNGAPLFSKKGKLMGCVLTTYSINYLKEKETELRQSEEKFRLTNEAAYDAIILINSDGMITYFNRAAEKIFGFTEAEVLGKDMHKLMMPTADASDVKVGMMRFKDTGEGEVIGVNRVVHAQRKDGEVFPCEVSVNAVSLDGEWHAVGIIRDITERKRSEELLKLAMEKAERASEAKGMFLANMSHEIRTPMNGIIGMTELALRTNLDDRQRNYLEKIKFSANTLLSIINDILDFSKIEAGKLDIEFINFNIIKVLDSVRSLVGIKAEEKDLEFKINLDPKIPIDLIGDPVRISQVIMNLCSNAVKFTESGGVYIAITFLRKEGEKFAIRFDVKDTGIGMTEEYQRNMFTSFTQADETVTRKYGGTGLGLAISKQLVELMNGQIWCTSKVGEGTTFSFTLNFEVPDVFEQIEEDYHFDHGTKILVIDDNFQAREIYQEALTDMGAQVELCKDKNEILNTLGKEQWDGILLDLQMPDFSGYEVYNLIHDEYPEMINRIIIQTAYGSSIQYNRIPTIDKSRILIKPINKKRLIDILGGREKKVEAQPSILDEVADLSGYRILLVEDNEINAMIAEELLEEFHTLVDKAVDGREAVDKVMEKEYDIILMDIQMPVLGGVEATKEILERRPNFKTPIIAMTAHVMEEDVKSFLELGMADHVGKPIDPEELKRVMLAAINKPESK